MSAAKPVFTNLRTQVGSLTDEELRRLKRERGELITRLRRVSKDIADAELLAAVSGVETIDTGAEDKT